MCEHSMKSQIKSMCTKFRYFSNGWHRFRDSKTFPLNPELSLKFRNDSDFFGTVGHITYTVYYKVCKSPLLRRFYQNIAKLRSFYKLIFPCFRNEKSAKENSANILHNKQNILLLQNMPFSDVSRMWHDTVGLCWNICRIYPFTPNAKVVFTLFS